MTTGIINLPPEVLAIIFDYLDLHGRKSCRLVCHNWRVHVDHKMKYRVYLNNGNAEAFFNSCLSFRKVTVNGTNSGPRMSSGNREFPTIKEIVLLGNAVNSEGVIKNFLKYGCDKAGSLSVASLAFSTIRRSVISNVLRNSTWEFMTKLKFRVPLGEHQLYEITHLASTSTFLKFARIPILNKFCLEIDQFGTYGKLQVKRFFLNFYKFMATHASSLRRLRFRILQSDQNFQMPPLTAELKNSNSRIQKLTLNSCLLNFPEILLFYSPHVKKFKLSGENLRRVSWDNLRVVIESSVMVERLKLQCTNVNLDMAWFNNCVALQSFELDSIHHTILQSNEPKRFQHLKEVICSNGVQSMVAIRQLISENFESIERLDLSINQYLRDNNDWGWLTKCKGLRRVDFGLIHDYRLYLMDFSLPHLLEAKFYNLSYGKQTSSWIIRALPNLEILHIDAREATIPFQEFQSILHSLVNLKQLCLQTWIMWGDENKEIQNYCNSTKGLKWRDSANPRNSSFSFKISIDGLVFNREIKQI